MENKAPLIMLDESTTCAGRKRTFMHTAGRPPAICPNCHSVIPTEKAEETEVNSGLIVVDMINDFVRNDGVMWIPGAQKIIPTVIKEIETMAERGGIIFLACDCHEEGDNELEIFSPHAMVSTDGANIFKDIDNATNSDSKIHASVYYVPKNTFSAFHGTRLPSLLAQCKITQLRVVGVATSICVLHTVAGALFRGFDVTVVEKGCADILYSNEWAMDYMHNILGANVE